MSVWIAANTIAHTFCAKYADCEIGSAKKAITAAQKNSRFTTTLASSPVGNASQVLSTSSGRTEPKTAEMAK